MADKGVVRSAFFHVEKNTIIYRVERQSTTTKLESSVNMVSVKDEDIAFAIHCPILIKVEDDVMGTQMDGEIISIQPVIDKKRGRRKILYTVLLNSKEGDAVRVEDNVQADRISYRLSLHAIQARLRDVVVSSSHHPNRKVAVGIRSSAENGQPVRNKAPRQLQVLPPKIQTKQTCLVTNHYRINTAITTMDTFCADNNDIGSYTDEDGSTWVDEEDLYSH